MRRWQACDSGGSIRTPRWVEVTSTGGDDVLGFLSFRIHGWRRPVLAAVRPFRWAHIRLLHRWAARIRAAALPLET